MLDFLQAEYGSQMLSLDGVNSAGLAWSECLVSNEATPFELAERHFLNDKITQAMERLPQKEQQVLTGIYLEDKKRWRFSGINRCEPGAHLSAAETRCTQS